MEYRLFRLFEHNYSNPESSGIIIMNYLLKLEVKCGVLLKRKELLSSKKNNILATAARYGAFNIRIFGSVARGDDDENSDIDFLVELEPGRSILDLGGLLIELQDLLGCPVDIVTENGLKERIRERVLNEVINL